MEQTISSQPIHIKIMNRLCGKLIVGDGGTSRKNTARFMLGHCHIKYGLSQHVELKPSLH